MEGFLFKYFPRLPKRHSFVSPGQNVSKALKTLRLTGLLGNWNSWMMIEAQVPERLSSPKVCVAFSKPETWNFDLKPSPTRPTKLFGGIPGSPFQSTPSLAFETVRWKLHRRLR